MPPASAPDPAPRLAREVAQPPSRPLPVDASLHTARVPGASPVGDFATLHAAHLALLARAQGQPLAALARAQRPNALEHHGNLYELRAVYLALGGEPLRVLPDFDPHAIAGLNPMTPDTAMAQALRSAGPSLHAQGARLLGVAPLDLAAPACITCHTAAPAQPARLLYLLQEVADD